MRNVTTFGAFVDVGMKNCALIPTKFMNGDHIRGGTESGMYNLVD